MAERQPSWSRPGGAGPFKPGSGAMLCCPEHPEANLVEDYHAGDMVCPECGLVVGDRSVLVSYKHLYNSSYTNVSWCVIIIE